MRSTLARRTPGGLLLTWALLAMALPRSAPATDIASSEFDEVVTRAMTEFAVPGVAVGIVKDGITVLAKGYGVREAGGTDLVTPDTLFAIGSTTKAFTTAALAILVDEGKIRWDDKVIDHLPEFRLHDPYVTREFTVRDLLTHRSGLGPGAGDLMIFPGTDFTRAEVIHNLRHLRPVTGFRAEFAYDNLLYIVGGEIIHAVTGAKWEDFVEHRILRKLGMASCATLLERASTRDRATPHVVVEGQAKVTARMENETIAAAGGIQCDVSNLLKWLNLHLAAGKAADGTALFSAELHAELWSPQTIGPVPPVMTRLNRTHFRAYGLGWNLEDFDGYRRVFHAGGTLGMTSQISLIPELGLGVVILSNGGTADAINAINLYILKHYTGAQQRDWVQLVKAAATEREAAYRKMEARASQPASSNRAPPLPLAAYAGTYRDAWRGDVFIKQVGDRLTLRFSRTDRMQGSLEHVGRGVFVVRWQDRSLSADAYVRFSTDFAGDISGMSMQAVSPRTDFSFDFQDLDFRKAD